MQIHILTRNIEKDDCFLIKTIAGPTDVSLFHEIVHAIYISMAKLSSVTAIEKRYIENIVPLWKVFLSNDEEFATMYGVENSTELNSINESDYSAAKYRYYLDPNAPIKYPRFGIGQYQCLDLDPRTGLKLTSL